MVRTVEAIRAAGAQPGEMDLASAERSLSRIVAKGGRACPAKMLQSPHPHEARAESDGIAGRRLNLDAGEARREAGIDVVPACVWGTDRAIPAAGVRVWPLQSVGIEVEAPLDRARFPSAAAYAIATWARVVAMADRRGANEPFGR